MEESIIEKMINEYKELKEYKNKYVEKNYISKSVIKQKYLELLWEQNEGKNIVENRFKIELLEELMEDTKDE